ncbi:hypothetical protein TNCT_627491 [Trichonephila clavata]|uniref:Uncharacterized protein n=1 Tax=Trichonephila clavata TaxID=2740835 RepID=A0A8X6FR87_TRICU|nr:hypothetical protein TNCT_627491 [Trichonephila clavata]
MFKNCRKEDLRIVALELGETLSAKVTIVELSEIIKENKYFKDDVEFVKELIQYTIEDRKKAVEDRKKAEEDRKKAEEDRKKAEEARLREKELELELARLHRVNSDNERIDEGYNSLAALVKSVRILTVKVPNRPEVKAILDSGSTSNFVTKSLCELIGLKKYKSNVLVSGLSKSLIPIESRVTVSISNKEGSYVITLAFFFGTNYNTRSCSNNEDRF